ncbi:MAG TPA: ShlB/FhaC/HecB family hemolysin secretion/activation protein [Puia sp.]|nr:ShlB/FhaC/HecB family hemolysin secretion/activation protein [Puia sp.]
MAKVRGYGRTLLWILLLSSLKGVAQYPLHIIPVDKDSVFIQKQLAPPASFKSREACTEYIYALLPLLQAKGYATASVDSIRIDDKAASIRLYTGSVYRWARISTRKVEPVLLAAVGWNDRAFSHRPVDFKQFQVRQQMLLDYLENNGYPFAKVSLDSIVLTNNTEISAQLRIDKGPLYKIDSIRLYGTAKISNDFLQRYLNIPNGSIYRKERLEAIHKKILGLPYVQEQQPWTLTMLGEGSVVNLYLKPKRSSEINALIGFLPSSDPVLGNKILVTGEATINLKNTLGNGESIGLNWQQLQQSSPRLDLSFQQPYLFHSPFGLNASFDLYKQDSSYINVNAIIGAQYALSPNKSGSVFLQEMSSSLLDVDTLSVIASHALPSEADVSATSLGMTYDFNNTNYRFNPLRGNEFSFFGTVGIKKVKENPQIAQLKDPNDSSFNFASLYDTVRRQSYEFLLKVSAAHYFPLTRASTLKLAFNGGIFSSPNTYRNELFLIGGYRLLRGFDEQSILASQYTVGTLEYRYLVGLNSFLFTFLDVGWAKNNVPGYNLDNTYLGTGLGMAFETKAGIFNISYALGKQDNSNFNFHDAKIHLGYVSFF